MQWLEEEDREELKSQKMDEKIMIVIKDNKKNTM